MGRNKKIRTIQWQIAEGEKMLLEEMKKRIKKK